MKQTLVLFASVALEVLVLPVLAYADLPKLRDVELLIGPEQTSAAELRRSPLNAPFGIDFSPTGDMFIVELEGGRVHRWVDGKLSLYAGNGAKGYHGDGGSAAQAVFNGMHNVAITQSQQMYLADTFNHVVRHVDLTTGTIRTLAGNGQPGFAGDGGPAAEAQFNYLMCVTLTPDERQLLATDLKNQRIRAIDLEQETVRTVAGNGKSGVPRDGGVAVESPLVDPRAAAMDSQKRLYILERNGHALRRVDPDGKLYTVAGTGQRGHQDGPAAESQWGAPKHLCVDHLDRVWVADDMNAAIRVFDPQTNQVSTVLGRGMGRKDIELSHPHGVCLQQEMKDGQPVWMAYLCDTRHNRVFRAQVVEQ